MNPTNRQRLIALCGTVLFHAAIVLILLLTWLMPASIDDGTLERTLDADDSEILLGSEYVIAGDVEMITSNNNNVNPASSATVEAVNDAPGATDRVTQGAEGASMPTVSSKQPSPMKVEQKPVPSTPGTTKNEEPEKKPQQQLSQETSQNVSNRTNFGSKNTGEASGVSGSSQGNGSTGAISGSVGGQLAGRSVAKWAYPAYRPLTGRIVVRVTVDSSGNVVKATYSSGSGAANSDARIRQSCVEAALKSRFSVAEGSRPQSGTITYNIK